MRLLPYYTCGILSTRPHGYGFYVLRAEDFKWFEWIEERYSHSRARELHLLGFCFGYAEKL